MLNVNFKQLEVFVAVADCHSFTEAANRLYLAQSTVSNHVQALENALKVNLFQRESKKNILLTQEGQRVYQYAREILGKCAELEEETSGDMDRSLTLGASTAPAQGILPKLLCDFIEKHPQCCCTVKNGDSADVQHKLLSGELQVGFVGSADDLQALTYEKIAEDHLVMITPHTSYFVEKKQAGVYGLDMMAETIIFRESGSATQRRINNYLSERDIDPQTMEVAAYVSMPEILKEMVERGVGVSIISEMAVKQEILSGKLLAFPLEETPVCRNIYMAYRKKGPLSDSATDFVRFVRRKLGNMD